MPNPLGSVSQPSVFDWAFASIESRKHPKQTGASLPICRALMLGISTKRLRICAASADGILLSIHQISSNSNHFLAFQLAKVAGGPVAIPAERIGLSGRTAGQKSGGWLAIRLASVTFSSPAKVRPAGTRCLAAAILQTSTFFWPHKGTQHVSVRR